MDNRYPWVVEVEAALRRVTVGYRDAAKAIEDAILADPHLTQKWIAQQIGMSTGWVSDLLTWYRRGCEPADGPFAASAAARRRAKEENAIQTSESELGQLCLLWGQTDYVPGQAEATLNAVSFLAECRMLTKRARKVRCKNLVLVFHSSGDKRRETLERLGTELEQTRTAIKSALDEIRAALKKVPRVLEAAE